MRARSGMRPSYFAFNLVFAMAWFLRQISGQNVTSFPTYAHGGGGTPELISR
jgi:hypothetical protein